MCKKNKGPVKEELPKVDPTKQKNERGKVFY